MRQRKGIFYNIDWISIILYLILVFFGWINIYASVYNEEHQSILDSSQRYGKQMIWILLSIVLIFIILMLDSKFFSTFAFLIYGLSLFSLIAVLIFGTTISGSRSWFQIGGLAIQPAEFAKFATALAVAKYLSTRNISLQKFSDVIRSIIIIAVPALLILLQHDTGSAIVYAAFVLVLYREGLSGAILLMGVLAAVLFILTLVAGTYPMLAAMGLLFALTVSFYKKLKKAFWPVMILLFLMSAFIFSVNFTFTNVLEPHQTKRINVLLGIEQDIHGAGYNVNQSKIAIGSGGLSGKGFLQGTQTKYDFVPEQSTDFIFCTVGEEWGFYGSLFVVIMFSLLLVRIVFLAERQRSSFSRIYGYGVASILLFHFAINIGMTIGLAPVIGIPLPFFSYGGSSLWAFSILLFTFIRLDASRLEVL